MTEKILMIVRRFMAESRAYRLKQRMAVIEAMSMYPETGWMPHVDDRIDRLVSLVFEVYGIQLEWQSESDEAADDGSCKTKDAVSACDVCACDVCACDMCACDVCACDVCACDTPTRKDTTTTTIQKENNKEKKSSSCCVPAEAGRYAARTAKPSRDEYLKPLDNAIRRQFQGLKEMNVRRKQAVRLRRNVNSKDFLFVLEKKSINLHPRVRFLSRPPTIHAGSTP